MSRIVVFLGLCVVAMASASAGAETTPTCDGLPATIVGTNGDDVIDAQGGVVVAKGGNDQVTEAYAACAGAGDDVVSTGNEDGYVSGGSGDDLISTEWHEDETTLVGGPGNDRIIGGSSWDEVSYSPAAGGITANLDSGVVTGEGRDVISGIEKFFGSEYGDQISGVQSEQFVLGRKGNDVITGGTGPQGIWGQEGDDVLRGGNGSDYLNDTEGLDKLYGEGGADRLFVDDGVGGDVVDGGVRVDDCAADPGDTVIRCE